MKKRKKWSLPFRATRYLPLGIVLLGAAAAVAIFVNPQGKVMGPITNLSEIRPTCQGDQQFACYSGYFETRTKEAGAKTALADLQQLYEQGDTYIQGQCHQMGH